MYRIGDFSKLTFVSIRMLRYYDEVGIFKPAQIDDFTGYRMYSAKQIDALNLIVMFRDMGFNVKEIAKALDLMEQPERLRAMLTAKREEAKVTMDLATKRLHMIDSAIKDIGKENTNMNYQVAIKKKVPAYLVVSVRDVIPAYNQEGVLWDRISRVVEENKLPVGQVHFATYYGEGHQDQDVEVEVVMEVKNTDTPIEGGSYRKTEPVEMMASVLVAGAFTNIGPAFGFLAKWIEDNGYSVAANARQVPLKGPWNESDEADYLTEIQIPIK